MNRFYTVDDSNQIEFLQENTSNFKIQIFFNIKIFKL